MSTRHLVDPELLPLLDLVPPLELGDDRLPAIRQAATNMLVPLSAGAPKVVDISGPSDQAPISLRIFEPVERTAPLPVIYHVHGGGFVLGSAAMNDGRNRALSDKVGAIIVSVDYRLAPEHPFPIPVEDCYSGLCWVINNAEALGADPSRIGVLGESAGGGLAAALTLLARDRAGPKIAGQFLLYPMLDLRTGASGPPVGPFGAGEFIWTAANNRFGWQAMRGKDHVDDDHMPYLSPSLAKSLHGLPPAFVAVGALDLFRDENLAYARDLIGAGVATELHMYDGAIHGFDLIAAADVSRRFERDLVNALTRGLATRRGI